jgi:hypothetical protein
MRQGVAPETNQPNRAQGVRMEAHNLTKLESLFY